MIFEVCEFYGWTLIDIEEISHDQLMLAWYAKETISARKTQESLVAVQYPNMNLEDRKKTFRRYEAQASRYRESEVKTLSPLEMMNKILRDQANGQ